MKSAPLAKILNAVKFNYLKEDDSELGRVDFGVLRVAMMVAALDGVVQPDEFRAFAKLADRCRVSKGEKAARYNAALHSAGSITPSSAATIMATVRTPKSTLPKADSSSFR